MGMILNVLYYLYVQFKVCHRTQIKNVHPYIFTQCNCFSQCESCAPLYNDKPFRSGDQLQPMNCRPCQCYSHALSCHYDALADDHPDEHYRGGGGVCDNCMHNTTGTDLAKANYMLYG